MSTGHRVIVGVDGSCGSLQALRVAVEEARRRHCPLVVAHALRQTSWPAGWLVAERAGYEVVERSLADALGGCPRDLEVIQTVVEFAEPGRALVYLSSDPADLIVVGARVPRGLGRLHRSGTDTYCVRHAPCPVLTVPPPDLLRLVHTSRRERRDWQRGLDGLLADRDREVPVADPTGRELLLGCGAALHHLRVVLAAGGWRATVQRLPDPAHPDLLARVELTGRGEPDQAASELDDRVELAVLAGRAERIQSADPAYADELATWTGHRPRRDGVPASQVPHVTAE